MQKRREKKSRVADVPVWCFDLGVGSSSQGFACTLALHWETFSNQNFLLQNQL